MIGITKADIGLAEDASKTAHTYLVRAISSVEEVMGKGSAKANPDLVIAVMRAASSDYLAAMLGQRIAPGLDEIAAAIREAGESIRAGLDE